MLRCPRLREQLSAAMWWTSVLRVRASWRQLRIAKGPCSHRAAPRVQEERGAKQDTDLDAAALQELTQRYKGVYKHHGSPFPEDAREQLRCAIVAVFQSWQVRALRCIISPFLVVLKRSARCSLRTNLGNRPMVPCASAVVR